MELEFNYYDGRHLPAFGSWNWDNDLQNLKSGRQAKLISQICPESPDSDDRDLYFPGDLYENHLVSPALIVVPRCRAKNKPRVGRRKPKPVDEDLYKISPELLCTKAIKKRKMGFFSSCFVPTCV